MEMIVGLIVLLPGSGTLLRTEKCLGHHLIQGDLAASMMHAWAAATAFVELITKFTTSTVSSVATLLITTVMRWSRRPAWPGWEVRVRTIFIDGHVVWSPRDPSLLCFFDNTEQVRQKRSSYVHQRQLLATIVGADDRYATCCVRCHHRLLGVEDALDDVIAVSAILCALASPFPRWYTCCFRSTTNM